MNDSFFFFIPVCLSLLGLSLGAFLLRPEPIRQLIALNILGSSVFLVFGTVARRNWADGADPVPQAIVITGIVVAVSATAFALSLLRGIRESETQANESQWPGGRK